MEWFVVRQIITSLSIASAIALSACASYDASYGDCAVHCTDDSGCPNGLTCGAEGVCRAAGAEACTPPNDGTGGTITHAHGRTIHTFSAGQATFTPSTGTTSIELLVVAGGGGGGSTRGGGGGGAGGLVYAETFVIEQPSYAVIVGYGGPSQSSGGNSTFGPITAIGGGAGRSCTTPNGGSGGGASHDTNDGPAGAGTSGQGANGGTSGAYNLSAMTFTGAGGGGAASKGTNGTQNAGGDGGSGLAFEISGAIVYYAGGGGGGDQDLATNNLALGHGGLGGGGNGGLNAVGSDGVNGTGGGGGGGGGRSTEAGEPPFFRGGRGGDGVVIISYPTTF